MTSQIPLYAGGKVVRVTMTPIRGQRDGYGVVRNGLPRTWSTPLRADISFCRWRHGLFGGHRKKWAGVVLTDARALHRDADDGDEVGVVATRLQRSGPTCVEILLSAFTLRINKRYAARYIQHRSCAMV